MEFKVKKAIRFLSNNNLFTLVLPKLFLFLTLIKIFVLSNYLREKILTILVVIFILANVILTEFRGIGNVNIPYFALLIILIQKEQIDKINLEQLKILAILLCAIRLYDIFFEHNVSHINYNTIGAFAFLLATYSYRIEGEVSLFAYLTNILSLSRIGILNLGYFANKKNIIKILFFILATFLLRKLYDNWIQAPETILTRIELFTIGIKSIELQNPVLQTQSAHNFLIELQRNISIINIIYFMFICFIRFIKDKQNKIRTIYILALSCMTSDFLVDYINSILILWSLVILDEKKS